MDANLDDILYREFWIQTSRKNVRDLSRWLCDNVGAENFDKLTQDEEPCKTDKKSIAEIGQWVLNILKEHPELMQTTRDRNKQRRLSLLVTKLNK